jgi:starch synthase (maltosyl-transferring)
MAITESSNPFQNQSRLPEQGRVRAVIEHVSPQVDCGRFAIKRILGDLVTVNADIFVDGHDVLSARLLYRHGFDAKGSWREASMRETGNDQWVGEFEVTELGCYQFTITAWVDHFRSWQRELQKKIEAGIDVTIDLLTGAKLIADAALRAPGEERLRLEDLARKLRQASQSEAGGRSLAPQQTLLAALLGNGLDELMARHAERIFPTIYEPWLPVLVDRAKARFSAWYEMFPRSASTSPGVHGTLRDCEARLPEIAAMGFDVLYLPPIHPIGTTHRKGKNNATVAAPDDPGSPWAIGNALGGHTSIEPQLGTLEDFDRLVSKCQDYGIELAMDLAYQCSPDHPYVKEHIEWFRRRPDGSVQFAENPPKKYEDIFPFDFETSQWRELWQELKSIVLFWVDRGVRIFRVDNPHTKPFIFWEWLIQEVKARQPEVLFLAEAFTRPKVMFRLAKLGFSQSYTYFAWRNTKREITEYFTELTAADIREYFRPNLWPNTPDILTEYLQRGGRPAFMTRLVLAATLGANYGIYGPAFELCENRPLAPGKEEYLDAEKYQLRHWNIHAPESLKELIGRINRARRQNPALQSDRTLLFHAADNEQLIVFSKHSEDFQSVVLVVVNLDPQWKQSGWVEIALEAMHLDPWRPFQVQDLLTGAKYTWQGSRNYVELDPHTLPAHLFEVRQ